MTGKVLDQEAPPRASQPSGGIREVARLKRAANPERIPGSLIRRSGRYRHGPRDGRTVGAFCSTVAELNGGSRGFLLKSLFTQQ
jgi:hypothetical protein